MARLPEERFECCCDTVLLATVHRTTPSDVARFIERRGVPSAVVSSRAFSFSVRDRLSIDPRSIDRGRAFDRGFPMNPAAPFRSNRPPNPGSKLDRSPTRAGGSRPRTSANKWKSRERRARRRSCRHRDLVAARSLRAPHTGPRDARRHAPPPHASSARTPPGPDLGLPSPDRARDGAPPRGDLGNRGARVISRALVPAKRPIVSDHARLRRHASP